jgi:hypothetical protein
VPAGTVKSRLFTARRRMRELLQAADAPEATAPVVGDTKLILSIGEGGRG